ncbi:EscU/YscU/HrcU family type III secretion system export apparatus switch protein [Piscinibacter sp. XHJ-5]|uniref:EscU/YscU/HrcU family type III secretion system export apparatus switch protein n=1 Tax=Piscinibacter sp. XHJ-5 TaxID=3037797 RepID=UPI002452D91B|nr:EscU/YscU/HrcU family type III secretion system export apparatus switch protein [Piscinibacter sp. XHJ-5]
MADQNAQDRNLPASPRKLQKAREDGQVARSRDLSHFGAMAAGGAVLVAVAPQVTAWLQQMLAEALRFDRIASTQPQAMLERLAALGTHLLWAVIPLGALMALVAIAGSVLIGGWNWTLKPLAPKFDKLNPIAGLPRLFSRQQLIDALKACLLALVLGTLGALYLRGHIDAFGGVIAMPLPDALRQAGETVVGGLMLLLLALAVFAAVDAPLQRHLHASRLKMSHQEMKQEHKELEGNSEVKAKIKVRMREMSRRRMLAAVPKADLVVMNPTHYAVALKYDDTKMAAPRVVAKGADLLAMAIRDAAKGAQVPVLQAAVLARALYAHAELDREIPAALFSAVAQVLAYVYQLRAALSGHAPMPGELPVLHVPAELDPHHQSGAAA